MDDDADNAPSPKKALAQRDDGGLDPERSHYEKLRAALKVIGEYGYFKRPGLRQAIEESTGMELPCTDAALREFVKGAEGGSHTIPAARDILTKFLFHTRLGRAARFPRGTNVESYDALIERFLYSYATRPENAIVTGNFYMFHGSYLQENCFAVHLLDVQLADDSILSVTDSIGEGKAGAKRKTSISNGCLMFLLDTPQILLTGNENRVGYSLFIGARRTDHPDNPLHERLGAIYGMNSKREHFYRPALIARCRGDRKKLLERTGVFERKDLDTMPQHLERFRELAGASQEALSATFEDPIKTMDRSAVKTS